MTFAKKFRKTIGMNKPAVITITDTLGSDTLRDKLGVSHHAIRAARTSGTFAASWYAPLKALCEEVGIECPLSAFNWKAPSQQPRSPGS